MAQAVVMPPLGTTSERLRIVEWLKVEGDEIALGEPLLAVETDKATLEVESAVAGTLLKVVQEAGAVVDVGAVLAYVGATGEDVPTEGVEEPAPAPGSADRGPERLARSGKVTASPAVRRLAAERGLDLARIEGTGPAGRVERRDVEAAGQPPGAEIASPHRRALARRLERSAAIPQFSLGVTVVMTRAMELLERERSAGLPGLTYTHLLLRSIATALRAQPNVNVLWVDEGPWQLRLERPDVGLAVAGEDALYVVTIGEPDRLSLPDLVGQCERAADEARAGRISERFRRPVAVSLSNLGMVGVDRFSAVIDPDQTAIVAAGAVMERPGLLAGGVGLVPQLELTLTADHRVLDGMAAGRFLASIRDELERGDRESRAP